MTAPPDHRRRLLEAMAAALRDRDYHQLTVADVVQRARTSKRTFYEHFADKHECFVALLRDSVARTVADITTAVDPQAPWRDQARQAVEGLVASVEADPATYLGWIRAAPSLGDEGRALVREAMDAFVAMMVDLADTPALREAGVVPPSRDQAVVLWGGLRELVAVTLEDGRDVTEVVDVAAETVMLVLGPRP